MKRVDCTIAVNGDGKVRYQDSLERDGVAAVSTDRHLATLLERVRDWLRQSAAEEMFTSYDLKLFGELLLAYLLPEGTSTRAELERTLRVVANETRPLRVSLIFNGEVPSSSFPWELLILPCGEGPRFLCTHPQTTRQTWPSWIARRLHEPGREPPNQPPLCPRVLLVVADVPGQNYRLVPGSALDELTRLRDRRQIDLDTELTTEPTLTKLERKLQAENPPDLVHIIAHGDPRHIKLHSESTERRTRGEIHEVSPDDLARALSGRRPALVYLDACRTAEDGAAAPFVRRLLDADVPAVLAMQYPISNQDAQSFGERFYRTAFNEPIDIAVNQARQILLGKRRFAAPVLYVGGAPELRLAAERSAQVVDCPSAKCRIAGITVIATDTYCQMCGSDLEPCPRRCGALVLKGAVVCRNCRKPDQPQSQAMAPATGTPRGIA